MYTPCPGEVPSPKSLYLLGPWEESGRACQLMLLIKEVTHQEVLTLVPSERPEPNVRLPGQVTHWKCLTHATKTDVKCVVHESPEGLLLGPGSSPDPTSPDTLHSQVGLFWFCLEAAPIH